MNPDLTDELVAHLRRRPRGSDKATLDLRSFGTLSGLDLCVVEDHERLLRKFTALNLKVAGDSFDVERLSKVLSLMRHLRSLDVHLQIDEPDAAVSLGKGIGSLKLLRAISVEVQSAEMERVAHVVAAAIGGLGRVEQIVFRKSGMDNAALKSLLARGGRRFRVLDLANNGLAGSPTIREFSRRHVKLESLNTLDLSSNQLQDDGVEELAELSPRIPHLQTLSLESIGMSPEGLLPLLRAIQAPPWATSLKSLRVGGNKLESIRANPRYRSDDPMRWREYASSVFGAPAAPSSVSKAPVIAVGSSSNGPVTPTAKEKGRPPLSTAAELLYDVLAKKRAGAKKATFAWVSRKDWFDAAGMDRCRPDWKMLVDELIAGGWIKSEPFGPSQMRIKYIAITDADQTRGG